MLPIYLAIAATIVLIVGGVAIAYRNFKKTIDHRLPTALRNARALPVAEVRDATVAKVVGKVELATPAIRSPLSKRVCVCYRVRVEEEVLRGDVDESPNRIWITIVDEQRGVDFYVRDDSGLALVRYDGAESLFDWDEGYGDGTLESFETTPEYAAFCKRHGVDGPGRKLRCFEGALEVGERAHVMGTVKRGTEGEPTVLTKQGDAPLYIADADLFERDREVQPGPKDA